MNTGADLIRLERLRQQAAEGFSIERDARLYPDGELVLAAWAYLTEHPAFGGDGCGDDPPEAWPWDASWWKPTADPVANLVKAGALIAAELDRLLVARSSA